MEGAPDGRGGPSLWSGSEPRTGVGGTARVQQPALAAHAGHVPSRSLHDASPPATGPRLSVSSPRLSVRHSQGESLARCRIVWPTRSPETSQILDILNLVSCILSSVLDVLAVRRNLISRIKLAHRLPVPSLYKRTILDQAVSETYVLIPSCQTLLHHVLIDCGFLSR